MTEIAHELSRRASPRYLGEQVKETALNKTMEWKDDIISSPLALGLIGGALGAAIGGSIARSRRTSVSYRGGPRQRAYPSSTRRPSESTSFSDLRDDVSSDADGETITGKLADRAQDLKEKAADVVTGVREQIPSTAELGEMAGENPMLVALGGLALGAIAALLLPVSHKEREMLEPVKQRAGEAVEQLGNKMSDSVQQAQQKIAGQQDQQQQPARTEGYPSTGDSPLLPH
jgi:hypothetical protein